MEASQVKCTACNSVDTTRYSSKGEFVLYKCRRCGLVFVYPSPEDTSFIYTREYFGNTGGKIQHFGYSDYESDKEAMESVFRKILRAFERHVKGRKIFDVGAATGYFLDVASSLGWETHGVEISQFAADLAQKKGHNVYVGSFDADHVRDKEGSYDVVSMWDVLEHVKRPLKALKNAHKILKNGGILAINTINIDSTVARAAGNFWHLMVPPEHLNYFSEKSLKHLLGKAGFEVSHVGTIGKKFSISYIFTILSHKKGLGPLKHLANFFDKPFWRKIAVPVNLKDNIYVIARKI